MRVIRACVPAWSLCQRACVPAWLTCQRAKSVLTSHFYAPTCHFACHVLSWRANVPNGVPIFQTFLLRSAKENFYTLLLHKKFYILLDILIIHIICICIINRNCIILYFYTKCHIKEKCLDFFSFFAL